MPGARAILLLVLAVVISETTTSTAAAQSTPDSTAADVLFEEGRAALALGNVKEACDKFDTSRRLEPAVGTLLNLGECSERLERKRAAWVAFREALRFMPQSDERRSFARERIAALEAKLGKLVLRLENAPRDTSVLVDGEAITPPYDAPRLVDPGRHNVRVLASGYRESAFVAVVSEAQTASVIIGPGERTATSEAQPRAGEGASGGRTAGFVVGGAGLGILAGGLVFGIAALSSSSAARDRCDGGFQCPDPAALERARDEAGTGRTRATVSTVLVSAGAVATAVGIYLLLVSHRGRSAAPARVARPLAGLSAAGLEL